PGVVTDDSQGGPISQICAQHENSSNGSSWNESICKGRHSILTHFFEHQLYRSEQYSNPRLTNDGSSSQQYRSHHPIKSRALTQTTIWLVVAIAILFTLFRFTVRLYALRKLLADDVAVAVALGLLLSLAVMYQYAIPPMFEIIAVAEGREEVTSSLQDRGALYLKLQFAIIVVFWSEIWAVKTVMGLGLRLLQKLHINRREKVALGAIFSVSFIKILFAVVRVVKIGNVSAAHVNPIWLALWSMIEASVAVVVVCLPSFRVLFAHGRRQSELQIAVSLRNVQKRHLRSHDGDATRPLEGEEPWNSTQNRIDGAGDMYWHDMEMSDELIASGSPRRG
ncbi:MAG: hypothetical protein Q9173_007090, partial [Seirophora scorigena]